MKKIVSVLVILAVFSTAVFAAPLTVADTFDGSLPEQSTALLSEAELFADVTAVALTAEEADAIEGTGWVLGTIFGAIGTGVMTLVLHYGSGLSWGASWFGGLGSGGLIGFAIGYNL